MTHTVQAKETLYSISKKYTTTVEQLTKINGLKSINLFVGQVLKIDLPSPISPISKPPIIVDSVYERRKIFQVKKEMKGTFNNYVLSFPTPSGTSVTGVMRDNFPSPNIANSNGISYAGKSLFQNNIASFSDLCQQPFYVDLLHYIAKNEGSFDAVNSYDKAIFSFGFIQFTGGLASGSMLSRVLQRFKDRDEYAFNDCFGKYGMNIQNYKVPTFQVETISGIKEGDAAYLEVANDMQLTTAFIASGFRRSMIRSQVEIALEEYVLKALSPTQLIFINGANYNLNQIIQTQGGFALRVDLCVNRGLGGAILVLKKAIEQLMTQDNLSDLFNIDEKILVQKVADNDIESWKKQRVLKLLDSGFSFEK
jgi:hypothetical protein